MKFPDSSWHYSCAMTYMEAYKSELERDREHVLSYDIHPYLRHAVIKQKRAAERWETERDLYDEQSTMHIARPR